MEDGSVAVEGVSSFETLLCQSSVSAEHLKSVLL